MRAQGRPGVTLGVTRPAARAPEFCVVSEKRGATGSTERDRGLQGQDGAHKFVDSQSVSHLRFLGGPKSSNLNFFCDFPAKSLRIPRRNCQKSIESYKFGAQSSAINTQTSTARHAGLEAPGLDTIDPARCATENLTYFPSWGPLFCNFGVFLQKNEKKSFIGQASVPGPRT